MFGLFSMGYVPLALLLAGCDCLSFVTLVSLEFTNGVFLE